MTIAVMSNTTTQPAQLLTRDDLAALMQVSRRTVQRRRADGTLPKAIVVGGTVRWDAAVIARFLQSQTEE